MSTDVAVIGAGIIGCATALQLARDGASVTVYDRSGIAAGASGRNNGLIEHPYDAATESLYEHSVELLGEVLGEGFPRDPVGTLLLAQDAAQAQSIAAAHRRFPSLEPRLLDPAATRAAEPLLAEGFWGCMLRTGYPVMAREATEAFAQRAREAGVRFLLGAPVELVRERGQVVAVRAGEAQQRAGDVLAATGAELGTLLGDLVPDGVVRALWGVIVSVTLPERPRHPLIEGALASAHGSGDVEVEAPFTLLDSPSWLAVGSTMLEGQRPDPELWSARLLARGARFVPSIARAQVRDVLVCARPRSFDNRPLLGRVPGQQRLWLAGGHGGRGMSTGPASALLIARAILSGDDESIPPALSARRLSDR